MTKDTQPSPAPKKKRRVGNPGRAKTPDHWLRVWVKTPLTALPDEIVFSSVRLMSEDVFGKLFQMGPIPRRNLLVKLGMECVVFRKDASEKWYFSPWHLDKKLWQLVGGGTDEEFYHCRKAYRELSRAMVMDMLQNPSEQPKVRRKRGRKPKGAQG